MGGGGGDGDRKLSFLGGGSHFNGSSLEVARFNLAQACGLFLCSQAAPTCSFWFGYMSLPVCPHAPFASTGLFHEQVYVKSHMNSLLVSSAPGDTQDCEDRTICTTMKTVTKAVKTV